ncbi:MAG TPA: VOC family protein [Rhodanobacteraceae bacterium]|nr:VOC family protein [Rhodanobacteraceae bacterium]
MAERFQRITPFLWFKDDAEDAVRFYVSVFQNSRIGQITRYSKESSNASGQPEGSVMTIAFELDGQSFTAINGGPHFTFTEAVSFVVNCRTQEEIDYYWEQLSEGGDPKSQICGWLKDRFGLSWQVTPSDLGALMSDPDTTAAVMKEVLGMKKIDLAVLRRAAGK